jgi:hypothetical protein
MPPLAFLGGLMKCLICEKKLETKEVNLCNACRIFIEWKYGSVENYLNGGTSK